MSKPKAEAQASDAEGTPAPSVGETPNPGGESPPKNPNAEPAPLATPSTWAAKLKTPMHLFAPADLLHGWADHAHHWQAEPLKISKEDFEAALKAAAEFPTVAPHAPAFGKTVGEKFKDFKVIESKAAKAKVAEEAAKKGA